MSFERIDSKTSKKVMKKFLTNKNESDIINKLLMRSRELRKVPKNLVFGGLYLVN